ncbi:MAG: radical SAM protein, partial [Candidatus Altiarchaeota archaeon]|nr:radical SAM protein [Candidatus Altiarchaeota archaeon]
GINRVDKLDELCYPAWYKFKIKKYPGIYKERGKSLLPIFASRGCFGRCSFCATLDSLAKNSYRIRSPKCVAEELEYMVEKYKVSNFLFNDPCFPVQEKFVEELSKEIVDRGLNDKIIWMAETRIQKIPRSTFKMMYKSGCRIIAFGIESGNQEILDRINKNIKLDEIRRAVGNAKSEGLDVISSFMVGLPGDTKETIKETLNFAKELRVTQAFFSPTMLLPNTQIFEEAVKQGRIDKDFWKNYVLTGGDIPLNLEKDFTREELINIVQNAYRSFFLQPRIIANYLMKLKDSSSIKMYIKYAESIVKKKYSGI